MLHFLRMKMKLTRIIRTVKENNPYSLANVMSIGRTVPYYA